MPFQQTSMERAEPGGLSVKPIPVPPGPLIQPDGGPFLLPKKSQTRRQGESRDKKDKKKKLEAKRQEEDKKKTRRRQEEQRERRERKWEYC
jgi:hypothetical protein